MFKLISRYFTPRHITNALKTSGRFLCDFIAPPACNFCNLFLEKRTVFCDVCTNKIQQVVSCNLEVTKKYGLKVFAVGAYKDPLKKLILAKRWSCVVSSKQLAQLILAMPQVQLQKYDYIISVPLHWMRRASRGFNQSYEMALYLHEQCGVQLADILKRNRHTQFQSDLTQKQRITNLKGAFSLKKVDRALYKDKHLLLVDDVMTTGATLHAAARELIKLRPSSITAVVACRAL